MVRWMAEHLGKQMALQTAWWSVDQTADQLVSWMVVTKVPLLECLTGRSKVELWVGQLDYWMAD